MLGTVDVSERSLGVDDEGRPDAADSVERAVPDLPSEAAEVSNAGEKARGAPATSEASDPTTAECCASSALSRGTDGGLGLSVDGCTAGDAGAIRLAGQSTGEELGASVAWATGLRRDGSTGDAEAAGLCGAGRNQVSSCARSISRCHACRCASASVAVRDPTRGAANVCRTSEGLTAPFMAVRSWLSRR